MGLFDVQPVDRATCLGVANDKPAKHECCFSLPVSFRFFFYQINIDCGTREDITDSVSHPTRTSFDRAQRLIYRLMKKDSYPRFLKSDIYETLLQQAERR